MLETMIISISGSMKITNFVVSTKINYWPEYSSSCSSPVLVAYKPLKSTYAMMMTIKKKKKKNRVVSNCSNNNVTTTTKIVYKDNWFDRLAINYVSQALQNTSGMRNEEIGYESLVMASRAVFQNFDLIHQRQLIVNVLLNAIPRPFITLFKKFLPPSKFTSESCAAFTSFFFRWLLGPCEVRESEVEGIKEKNVVYIKKCRFLETSNCAGMCTNMCKIPTQEFMKNTLGIPVNMVPNFDDMSCEYIFGDEPPALQDDPALKQPCYKLCDVKHKHDTSCMS
uniref:beta-carotene isomerase D27, chloroplastic-like isoform X1 n=1 Tax=Erigeron canadensis TaxID=72917 RepID=UPI001CB98DA5|nr:beta-carotene isomerase D27, chloroplastic-like isoform X1 [Erigeron canadensis]